MKEDSQTSGIEQTTAPLEGININTDSGSDVINGGNKSSTQPAGSEVTTEPPTCEETSPRTLPFSELKKNRVKRSSNRNSSKKPDNNHDALSKQNWVRYDMEGIGSFDGGPPSSNMDFSQPFSVTNEQQLSEAFVEQIHDQRIKHHQLQASSSTTAVPGAYSVDMAGRFKARSTTSGNDRDNPPTTTNEYGSSIMQLEAVPVDETMEQAKVKDMEDQMNREIERRISLERKINSSSSELRKQRLVKEMLPILMSLILLLAGVSVGLYFLLAPPNPSHPSSKDAAAATPSVDFLFPPPTAEDCEKVFNGTSVVDQDKYIPVLANAIIAISTHEPWEDSLDQVMLELRNEFESSLIPSLVGCFDTNEQILYGNFTEDRYSLANGIVLNVTKGAVDCDAAEADPCVQLVVHFKMWMKMELTFLAMIIGIDLNFGKSLMENIGKDNKENGLIKHAEMVIILPPLGSP